MGPLSVHDSTYITQYYCATFFFHHIIRVISWQINIDIVSGATTRLNAIMTLCTASSLFHSMLMSVFLCTFPSPQMSWSSGKLKALNVYF